MKLILTIFSITSFCTTYGQYYFNDIVSTQFSNEQYRILRSSKVRKITATSYESDNTPTAGFLLEQDISPDGKKITISTMTSAGKKSAITNTYELGRLKKNLADEKGIDNKTDYFYDSKGRLQKVTITTVDSAMKRSSVEVHEWQYNEAGQPQSMLKIKNGTDTMQIELIRDEQGNTGEEHWKKKGHLMETYYYYYNPKNELTDIVRYNNRLKKMLPDYLYEYDANGRISQLTQVSLNNNGYFIWKYTYNDKGLKQQEVCYNKSSQMLGRIEYRYE